MYSGGTSRKGIAVEVQHSIRADSHIDSYTNDKHDILTTSEQASAVMYIA